jgi:hypothetical protein
MHSSCMPKHDLFTCTMRIQANNSFFPCWVLLENYVSLSNKPISDKQIEVGDPLLSSRPAWGIVSLCQTTDFTPGYIAERACREELLGFAVMMTSPTQQCRQWNMLFLEAPGYRLWTTGSLECLHFLVRRDRSTCIRLQNVAKNNFIWCAQQYVRSAQLTRNPARIPSIWCILRKCCAFAGRDIREANAWCSACTSRPCHAWDACTRGCYFGHDCSETIHLIAKASSYY